MKKNKNETMPKSFTFGHFIANLTLIVLMGIAASAFVMLIVTPLLNASVVIDFSDIPAVIRQVANGFRLIMLIYCIIMVIYTLANIRKNKDTVVFNLVHAAVVVCLAIAMPFAAAAIISAIW